MKLRWFETTSVSLLMVKIYRYQWKFFRLTENSGRTLPIVCSPSSRTVQAEVFRTLENTSIWWQAVETLVISPWYPASEINCQSRQYKLLVYLSLLFLGLEKSQVLPSWACRSSCWASNLFCSLAWWLASISYLQSLFLTAQGWWNKLLLKVPLQDQFWFALTIKLAGRKI